MFRFNLCIKGLFLVFALSFLGLEGNAHSAEQALKIAVFDSRMIMEKSEAVKDVRTQIEAKFKEQHAAASKIQENLKKRHQDIESKRAVLSKDAFEKQDAQLRNESEEASKQVYLQRMSIDSALQDAIGKVEDEVTKIITDYAKTNSINLVLHKMQTFYNDEQMDISEDILKQLDKRMLKMKVVFQDPANFADRQN